ncbi:uncharacterized protein H6S33_003382 [Morchella sextelata]|uniref:uncharacterized protein n=1 Tax=Morchella sextelata TaxID=1174677 RepID=UPI001D041679|nr:uncharacterized protein H6S33_003382 [Morchella sextelata]KAH0606548.1 hypothetical protein H6S33_003382 [Morchella sextelata]
MVTLKAHLRRYHQTYFSDIDTQTRGHSSLSNCPPLGTLDLTNLLFDTISTGNVSMVKGVLELGVDLNCGTFNNNGESFLHYTLRAGHKDIFQLLLEKGASADTMNREPRATILNSAISKGSIEYVELLLEWGARVNRLEEGISANTVDVSNIPPPLIVAIRNNQKESVRLLLENGADAESKDLHGNEAMFHAIQTSSDMVKLLLEKGASANTISAGGIFPKLPRGTPALIVAIKNDQKESVRLLLEKGADVNWVDRDGNTALIYAVKKSPDIVKLLLEKGASANTMTSAGIAALILAIQNDQSESVRLLLEKGADTSSKDWNGEAALILAIKKSPDMVKLLLETGASANIIVINTIMWTGSMFPRLPRGTPALIVAIKKDEKESVRLLLEKGADVESKDSDGNPALISALEKSPDMVKLLLEKGASANIIVINTIMWTGSMFPRLPRGTPALIVAIKKDEKESVRLLLEKGADVESKDSDGNPALILAIKESPDMVKLLLEKGESANTISSDRIPALILAIQNDQSKSVRLLLEKGADANTKDPKGEAAIFHVARITYPYREMLPSKMDKTNESKLAIIKLLISAGISVNIKDSQGTPILVLVALSRKLRVSAEFLISRGAERDVEVDALFEAIYFGMIKAVTTLIENGARVDSPDKAGVTPLMAAIVSPYYEYPILKTLLERLLNARSSVNYVNKKTNDSAVLLAAQRITADSAADELKLLLRHGANIDMTDRKNSTDNLARA